MNDAEREERAIWKLQQAGYVVAQSAGYYLVYKQFASSPERAHELDNLTHLVAYADAVYQRVWTGRKITPSV